MTTATSPEAISAASGSASFSAAPAVTTVATLVPGSGAASVSASPASAAASATASAEHPAKDGGLPQLRTEYWGGQIVWLLVIFAVFFLLIDRVFAPRLRKVIDTRGSTIAEDLANSRANRDEAEAQARDAAAEMAEAHAAARRLAAESTARSNAEIAAVQAAEDAKLNQRLGEAETRIRAARDEAMSHVKDIAGETASELVAKLTGKAPTAASLKSALAKG